jgi:hypothetical protein
MSIILTAEEFGISRIPFEGMIKKYAVSEGLEAECFCGKCELSSPHAVENFRQQRAKIGIPTKDRMRDIARKMHFEEGSVVAETKGWPRAIERFQECLSAL